MERRRKGGKVSEVWELEILTVGGSSVELERSVGVYLGGGSNLPLTGRKFRGGCLSSLGTDS